MIDIEIAVERALEVYPDKNRDVMEDSIRRMVQGVRETPAERGDFTLHSTYGVAVFQAWYENEDAPAALRVYVEVASDYDHGELI